MSRIRAYSSAAATESLSVFDTNSGNALQALPITAGVDDIVYVAGTRRIYASGNGIAGVS
jgi:hypothetical protein